MNGFTIPCYHRIHFSNVKIIQTKVLVTFNQFYLHTIATTNSKHFQTLSFFFLHNVWIKQTKRNTKRKTKHSLRNLYVLPRKLQKFFDLCCYFVIFIFILISFFLLYFGCCISQNVRQNQLKKKQRLFDIMCQPAITPLLTMLLNILGIPIFCLTCSLTMCFNA